PISKKQKESRKQKLMEIQKKISLEKNQSLIGQEMRLLVDGIEADFYVARSYRDAPEVDGEVLIPKSSAAIVPGGFYMGRIYDCNEYDLFANLDN
ncbi:MAG: 30S ribosomal protein S12 methylthiotransferase RimO, partial [Ignavibacteriaceae bacterium]|nr:30S ribosomal protein S12 methylthiotransferase RimO [Ignavibacteriaceae bacterium]